MQANERLISSDDHVDLSHDQIKSFLAAKFHAEYDDALGRFSAQMAKSMSADANNQWRVQQGLAADAEDDAMLSLANRSHAAAGRPG